MACAFFITYRFFIRAPLKTSRCLFLDFPSLFITHSFASLIYENGNVLLKLGYDLAQGYGVARPMLASDIPEWIIAYQLSDYRVQDK